MHGYLDSFVSWVNNLPLLLRLAVVALASAIEYVLPIFPGDTVVLAAGFLSAKGGLGWLELLLATLVGTLIGCFVTYKVGAAIANGQIPRRWLHKIASDESLLRFNAWYNRWGYFLIIGNRFFPGIRSFFFVAAGLNQLPLNKVLIYGIISALIFNSGIFALGFYLGNNIELVVGFLESYTQISYVILAVIILVFVAIKLRHWRR